MTINTTCPLCHETIGDQAMIIEQVEAKDGGHIGYCYSCPCCGIFLFPDADPALSDTTIMERIEDHRLRIDR